MKGKEKIDLEIEDHLLEDIKKLGQGQNQNEKILEILQKGLIYKMEDMAVNYNLKLVDD